MGFFGVALSTVAKTNLITAVAGQLLTRMLPNYVPVIGLPYEGEILMAVGGLGIMFAAAGKLGGGWMKIIAMLIFGALIGLGLERSEVVARFLPIPTMVSGR